MRESGMLDILGYIAGVRPATTKPVLLCRAFFAPNVPLSFQIQFFFKKNEPSSSPVFKKIDSSYLCTCLFNSVYESDSVEKMASRSFWLLRHRLAKGWFTAYMRIDQQIPGSLPTDSPAYLTKWAARQAGVPLKYQPCMHHSFPPETQKPLYKHHLSPKSMWCVSPVFQTLIIWVE